MLIKVTKAAYVDHYRIALTFNDGTSGVADLKECFRGPVFEPLKEVAFFKDFTLNCWTIEWENGADLAPEFLHTLVSEQNKQSQEAKMIQL